MTISKYFFNIADISLGVAWMLGAAGVFIFKTTMDGMLFMGIGFALILILKVIEYSFFEDMKNKGYL